MEPMSNAIASGARKKPAAVDPQDPAVVFTYQDLMELGHVLRRNITSRDELVAAIHSLTTISVDSAKVVLEPRLLQRLRSRCLDKDRWKEWLAEIVVKQLHDYAGW